MSYGMQVFGASGSTVVRIADSEKVFETTYAVTIGSGSSTAQTFDRDNDLCFISYTPTSGTAKAIMMIHHAAYQSGSGDNKLYFTDTPYASSITSFVTVDYIHLKKINTVSSPSGNYGLLIKNSAGAVQFDSRVVTTQQNGLFISGVKVMGSLAGNRYASGTTKLGPFSHFYQGMIYQTLNSNMATPIRLYDEWLVFDNTSNPGSDGVGVYFYGFQQALFGSGGSYLSNSAPVVIGQKII
jgi:hypothetical protein|tara:strand:+ start:341 stop:1060 length:720 start_codon:yes stop_codon:yes gene_type:complete